MRLRYSSALLITLAFLILSGCDSTEVAEPAPTPGGPSGEILFEDDFTDPGTGWDRAQNSSGLTDYSEGSYRIVVNTPNSDFWANPGLNYLDATIEVEAQKVAGSDENDFGVICRYQDDENFYFFIIGSDGFYGIGAVVNGAEPQLIGTTEMQFSRRINQGNEPNTIRAECVGNILRLYVDGKILDAVTDNRLVSGDIGLIAGTFDTPGTEIIFSNLVVRNP